VEVVVTIVNVPILLYHHYSIASHLVNEHLACPGFPAILIMQWVPVQLCTSTHCSLARSTGVQDRNEFQNENCWASSLTTCKYFNERVGVLEGEGCPARSLEHNPRQEKIEDKDG
jgi:hypothetical protein